jgi:hypothetical protein
MVGATPVVAQGRHKVGPYDGNPPVPSAIKLSRLWC